MTKYILTLALVALSLSFADAQSFYKKQGKFKRRYMAVAITGAVRQTERPGMVASEAKPATDTKEDESGTISARELRRMRRREARELRRAERIAAREAEQKYREERAALGEHMVAYRSGVAEQYSGR